jgi:hypothetical protein
MKASPHEVYEVLEEKKKLLEIREHIENTLDRVKQVLNSLAVKKLFSQKISKNFKHFFLTGGELSIDTNRIVRRTE